MFARLLALFLITPVVELALLIQLGDLIGFWPTVGIILVTGFTGTYLAKREGLSAWRRLQDSLNRGGLPGKELLDGAIILIAGALLITPGVLTDLAGFVGLLPFTRSLIRRQILKRIERALKRGTLKVGFGGSFAGDLGPDPWTDEADPSSTDAWGGEARPKPRHGSEPE